MERTGCWCNVGHRAGHRGRESQRQRTALPGAAPHALGHRVATPVTPVTPVTPARSRSAGAEPAGWVPGRAAHRLTFGPRKGCSARRPCVAVSHGCVRVSETSRRQGSGLRLGHAWRVVSWARRGTAAPGHVAPRRRGTRSRLRATHRTIPGAGGLNMLYLATKALRRVAFCCMPAQPRCQHARHRTPSRAAAPGVARLTAVSPVSSALRPARPGSALSAPLAGRRNLVSRWHSAAAYIPRLAGVSRYRGVARRERSPPGSHSYLVDADL
jgi:hypothetical protein